MRNSGQLSSRAQRGICTLRGFLKCRFLVASLLGMTMLAACGAPADEGPKSIPRNTLVIGIDVSGSFGKDYQSSLDFVANYIYAHLHGLGGLKQPTAVFVGSIGGDHPQETKSFQPIETFEGMSVPQIAA